jgi:transposase
MIPCARDRVVRDTGNGQAMRAWKWERVKDLLPGKVGDPGRSGRDNRQFVKGVLWVLRLGAEWHDLPERYGEWKSVHTRFSRWAKAGDWERLLGP